jgi:hypothetical protein
MINSLVVKLPYPHKFWGVTISLKRDVGFLFTNLSMFLFRENQKIETSKDYEKWIAEQGQNRLVTEMMYAAAQAYCMELRLKQTFTKSGLTAAVSMADQEIQVKIIESWRNSQTFGAVESKKKTTKKSA